MTAEPHPAVPFLERGALPLRRPGLTVALLLALQLVAILGLRHFRLDASSDALVLENDADLRYYDATRELFGSDSFLLAVVDPPSGEIFSPATFRAVENLAVELEQVEGVASVLSITRVPLFLSPPSGLFQLADGYRTLNEGIADDFATFDLDQVREELLGNPLYIDGLVSRGGGTTALQINLTEARELLDLEQRRYELRDLELAGSLDAEQQAELLQVEAQVRAEVLRNADERRELTGVLRDLVAGHEQELGAIELGGLPMISVDIVRYIERDLVIFGIASVVFVLLAVGWLFRSMAWTLAIAGHCLVTVLALLGLLGWLDWRITVVTSNLASLLFILTLAMSVHLAVRYREAFDEHLELWRSGASPARLPVAEALLDAMRHVVVPSLFTVLTTMVGFGSLYLSQLRPVMDFSLMMGIGLVLAFANTFLLLPALVLLLTPSRDRSAVTTQRRSPLEGGARYRAMASWAMDRRGWMVIVGLLVGVVGSVGVARLSVENSFVDYFRESSTIHRALTAIDERLGGTTPLEIVLTAEENDTWLTIERLRELGELHEWLAEQPEIGSVTSLHSLVEILEQIIANDPNEGLRSMQVNTFLLRTLQQRIPPEVAETALQPYVDGDYATTRITTRVRESFTELDREVLLERIRARLDELREAHEMAAEVTPRVTGMFVLYNNMLGSLVSSQVSTLALVFVAIAVMFLILLRDLRWALLALVPNSLPVVLVLGLLGWLGVPLDMMTIMIAAITLGISVDDTVHYLYRYRFERQAGRTVEEALRSTHDTVGRAMAATTVAVAFGFSTLALSNFKPTITFGLLTCLAMLTALTADLYLLPALLRIVDGSREETAG